MVKQQYSREELIKAEKIIVGMTLISENAEDIVNAGLTRYNQKHRLKKLEVLCNEFLTEFWHAMDEDAEARFQESVRIRENQIEQQQSIEI